MAILSASMMIRSISLFHVTLAALLLKNPAIISNQGVVMLLGESMQLVRPSYAQLKLSQDLTTAAHTPRLQQTLGSNSLHRRPLRLSRPHRPHRALSIR